MGRDHVCMFGKFVKRFGNRAGFFVLALLMCAGMLSGCGRDSKKNNDTVPTGSVNQENAVSPTATSTPTPSPTPTIPLIKQAYETCGRDDVYQIPLKEFEEGWFLMDWKCAGDYILLWFDSKGAADDYEKCSELVLLEPLNTTEQKRMITDYEIYSPVHLLADGTIVVEEADTHRIDVMDKNFAGGWSFVPCEGLDMRLIDLSDDGLLWYADETDNRIVSFNLQGETVGTYPYDPQYQFTRYLGYENGERCFVATKGDVFSFDYLYLSEKSGKFTSRHDDEADLGDDWKTERYSTLHWVTTTESNSMWFFHTPGNLREMCAFPKKSLREQVDFVQGKMVATGIYRPIEDASNTRDISLYDLEKRTVTGSVSDRDFPDCTYLSCMGIIGDSDVVLWANREKGSMLLIWTAGENTTPIEKYCDLTQDDPAECLKALLKEAGELGIEIKPDRTENDGTLESLGDFMAEMDLVNTFILTAKEQPEILKTKSGEKIQPENMRNNDGASYTFNPHVFSPFYLKEHGEKRRDAFYRYVDALRAGEDRFYCGDEGNANWSSGKFAYMFFPFASLYADAKYAGDGWADITYKIPKEEFLQKQQEFEDWIVKVLNDVLEEDYTDIEKALALYEYITQYCVYDYEMLAHNEEEEWSSKQSAYRVYAEKQGICGEIAILYQYLGLQCGLNVDEVVGMPTDPESDMHAWNYIDLDGQGYLIDATWGLSDKRLPDLKYFLFTDKLREERDGYSIESNDVGFVGLYGARKKFKFDADDERYQDLWEGRYIAFDEQEKCIFYCDLFGGMHRFDYGTEQ